jgi:excisionase family DNA binding protein
MELLSVREVAQVLGVSERRVRALVEGGRLPAIRVGARTYAILRSEVERFAKVPRQTGRPPKRMADGPRVA